MNILLTFDNGYSQHAGVVITSFLKNNAGSHTLYVISDYISNDNQQLLRKTISSYNCQIEFFFINTDIVKEFPIGKGTANTYVTIAIYFRLFITKVLPDSIDRILYLDCDTIVNEPVDVIWNHKFANGHCILALEETQALAISGCNRLHYPQNYSYFNSGVLLIDLNELRKTYNLKDAIHFIMHNDIKFHDQDVLNGMLYDKKEFMPLRYNVLDSFLKKNAKLPKRYQDQTEALFTPFIIHFSGPVKPWHIESKNPYTSKYYLYLQETPWKGYQPVSKYHTIKERSVYLLKQSIKWLLETMHLRYYSFTTIDIEK